MIKKGIFVIILMVLMIGSSFVSAININKDFTKKIFTNEEKLDQIKKIIDNIEDEKLKEKITIIFKEIIKDNGEIDVKSLERISNKYFKSVYEKLYSDDSNNENVFINGYSSGTSTIFEPPYSDCFSWGDKTPGIDEYSHGCNRYSGSIGAYANAFIGGATAEAMQQLNIYVGRQKTLTVDAEIIRTGGKLTFGFGSFAGTEKTWSWDDFQQNYHRSDVDPWWNWDIIILKIINIVSLFVGYTPNTISDAIFLLNDIVNFEELALQLQDLLDDDNAEILHITFSFSGNPGNHKIWAGLRATASACITGTASAVTMGQVSKITIDGIAVPEPPNIEGSNDGKVGDNLIFYAESTDPNNDKIRYCFEWGDGTNTKWTNFKTSGTKISETHTYKKKGIYKIKVIVEDIDKMSSETIKTIEIKGDNSKLRNILLQNILKDFFLIFKIL